MKTIAIIVLALASLTATAQQIKSEGGFTLGTPSGWSAEQSTLNIKLATKAKGVEEKRLASGWNDVQSDNYQTYAALWYFNGGQEISKSSIEVGLRSYFLEKSGIGQVPADKVLPVNTWLTELWGEANDLKTFYGGIAMLDPKTQKPLALNCLVHVRASATGNVLFLEFSPKPWDNDVWQTMDQLWADFKWDNTPYSSN